MGVKRDRILIIGEPKTTRSVNEQCMKLSGLIKDDVQKGRKLLVHFYFIGHGVCLADGRVAGIINFRDDDPEKIHIRCKIKLEDTIKNYLIPHGGTQVIAAFNCCRSEN